MYEPAWQQHWLGDSVPLADGLRSRYGGIVLDVAWALFEMRMQRDPGADPNQVWTTLTRDYLRIRASPRALLVGHARSAGGRTGLHDELRRRLHSHRGDPGPDPGGPRTVRDGRFDLVLVGGAAPLPLWAGAADAAVIEEFLGGPVSPAALLDDMRRMRN